MAQDALDHVALVDERNDAHLFPAFRAQERIGFPDLLDEFPPLGRGDTARFVFGDIDDLHGPARGCGLFGGVFVALAAGFIECREVIRATYQTFDGRVSEYELHPYHLIAYHGNWYLMAWNVEKKRVATFALSRFQRIEATGQTFTRLDGFSPETYARQAFGIVGGEKPIRVRLLFDPKLAVYITERQWHPSQEFRTRQYGSVEMRMETTGRKELVRWVLSWMPDVKVLAPKSLRDRIAEKLRDGLRAQQ